MGLNNGDPRVLRNVQMPDVWQVTSGPRKALDQIDFAGMIAIERCEWAEVYRIRAILGSCPCSEASLESGLRIYFRFV
eukprot:7804649-Karenia_brevis.AAC.1